jgi:hypothetical protein
MNTATSSELQLNREALADKVIGIVAGIYQTLDEHREEITELWSAFKNLPPGETIKGCRTKTEFCKTHLHRHIRSVEYMLKGGNHNRGETVSLPTVVTLEGEVMTLGYKEWVAIVADVVDSEGKDLKQLASLNGVTIQEVAENFKVYASTVQEPATDDTNWESYRVFIAARNMLAENPELCQRSAAEHEADMYEAMLEDPEAWSALKEQLDAKGLNINSLPSAKDYRRLMIVHERSGESIEDLLKLSHERAKQQYEDDTPEIRILRAAYDKKEAEIQREVHAKVRRAKA